MAPFSHLKESGVIKTITAPITHLKNALRTNRKRGGKV